ncbi:MAG: ParB N-terminal domain-containing protein [Nitrospira sp.]|nr:ParB N-terminal domain-containing protein [Nitrospira sp.]
MDLQSAAPPGEVAALHHAVVDDGGKVLAVYREPYGGRWLVMAALPIDLVEPTPYQRNLSDTHVRKLEAVIGKVGRFLDPIIAVRMAKPDYDAALPINLVAPTPYQRNLSDTHVRKLEAVIGKVGRFLDPIIAVRMARPDSDAKYWTPNGNHRLSAMRTLGAKSIVAIVVPEPSAAYQILALNTEKAHNLREKSLEVIRMYRELAQLDSVTEDTYALEFEEPALITLGLCYEDRPRFSGGAYHPVLKRVEEFLKKPLQAALDIRQQQANTLLELDDLIVKHVEALKAKGLTSPYLKSFIVARVNPVRFRPKDAPPLSFADALGRMAQAAQKFNPDKVKSDDLAKSCGIPDDAE